MPATAGALGPLDCLQAARSERGRPELERQIMAAADSTFRLKGSPLTPKSYPLADSHGCGTPRVGHDRCAASNSASQSIAIAFRTGPGSLVSALILWLRASLSCSSEGRTTVNVADSAHVSPLGKGTAVPP